jgi:hypothetical protein
MAIETLSQQTESAEPNSKHIMQQQQSMNLSQKLANSLDSFVLKKCNQNVA